MFKKENSQKYAVSKHFLFAFVLSHLFFFSVNAAKFDTVNILTTHFEDEGFKQGWTVQTVQGGAFWTKESFNGNSYMQISGFKAIGTDIQSYLISPEIDFGAYNSEVLTFKTKNGYYKGTTLSVWISTDYDGSNIETATWQQLIDHVDESNNTNSYGATFIESGDIDLSAYEGVGHIAFKYLGNTTALTTTYQVDDVIVNGIEKSFPGTLISGQLNDEIHFPYVAHGSESEIYTYTLSFIGVEGEIFITSPKDYLLSVDGTIWDNNLRINAGVGDGFAEVQIKLSPEQEYYYGLEQIVEHRATNAMPYKLKVKPANKGIPIDAGTLTNDKTLDIVTWNLEFFGISTKGTADQASFNAKLSKVAGKIMELDADVYAIQEVIVDEVNGNFFTPLIEKLNELTGKTTYAGVLAPRYSYYFQAASTNFPAQCIGFIYNINTVSSISSFSMFSDFYNGHSTPEILGYPGNSKLLWASGRLPK